MTKADVLSHPVRMRVVLTMVGDRELTTADIAEAMPDIPIATLYRHISALAEGKVLTVVSERRVRGAVERTYRLRPEYELRPEFTLADRKKAAKLSTKDQRAAFGVFAATLIASYDGYLAREDRDVVTDPVGYRTTAVYADDDDVREVTALFAKVLEPLMVEKEGKRRILISTVLVPN